MSSKKYLCNTLVIDDDSDMRLYMAEQLLALGCTSVSMAHNGEEALRILKTKSIEMIFTDILMPQMDGVELIRHLAKAGYRKGIAFISSCPMDVQQAAAQLAERQGLKFIRCIDKHKMQGGLLEKTLQENADMRIPLRLALKTLARTAEIEEALNEDSFGFALMPKVDMQSKKCVAVEMLSRWQHPVRGEIPPELFVDKIELQMHLSQQYNWQVVDKALRLAQQWQISMPKQAVAISINLPVSVFAGVDDYNRLNDGIRNAGIANGAIELELNNKNHGSNHDMAAEVCTRLRLNGVKLSLDGYGCNGASLELLACIPFNELKIDAQFIKKMTTDKLAYHFIKSTIGMAKQLNIKVTAEGVETATQWNILKNLGCDFAQGYWVSKPLSPAEFTRWLAKKPVVSLSA